MNLNCDATITTTNAKWSTSVTTALPSSTLNVSLNDVIVNKYNVQINKYDDQIEKYDILAPNKVILVTFKDGKTEKMICHKEDKFDLRKGLYLAISKHINKSELTPDGIEYAAKKISYTKKYVKMVDEVIKKHEKLIEEKKKAEEKQKEDKKREHERRMKNAKKKRERKIQLQKEAYLLAMKEFHTDKKSKK